VVDGQADVDVQLPQQRGRDGQGHVSLEGSGDVPVDLRRVTRRQSHNRPRLFVSQSGELVTWLSTRLTLQTRPAKVLEIFMSHERSLMRHLQSAAWSPCPANRSPRPAAAAGAQSAWPESMMSRYAARGAAGRHRPPAGQTPPTSGQSTAAPSAERTGPSRSARHGIGPQATSSGHLARFTVLVNPVYARLCKLGAPAFLRRVSTMLTPTASATAASSGSATDDPTFQSSPELCGGGPPLVGSFGKL